jgi:hypothetical protein
MIICSLARTAAAKVRPALLALAHVERRLGDVVFDELHLHEPVVRVDRERREERRLQPLGLALPGGTSFCRKAT